MFLSKLKSPIQNISSEFTPLEKRLMNEVRQYSEKNGVETARLINKNGRFKEMKLIESPMLVTLLDPKGIKIFGRDLGVLGHLLRTIVKLNKATIIHSHVTKGPLSSQDLNPIILGNAKKVTATTPDECFSSIENPKKIRTPYQIERWMNLKKKLAKLQTEKSLELGIIKLNSKTKMPELNLSATTEELKEYSDFSIKLLQDFSDKCGFKFKHNFDKKKG